MLCLVAQSCPTPCDPVDCSPPGSSVHGDLPEYWSGFHALLQGIFPTQGSNPGLPHCRQILYHLSNQENPVLSCRKAKNISKDMMDDACGGINAAIRRSRTTGREQGKRENIPYSLFINISYPTLIKANMLLLGKKTCKFRNKV